MSNAPDSIETNEYISASEEALFARDLDGQLIRATEATLDDLDLDVQVFIDGQTVMVKKALPLRNSQGIIMTNERGEPIPRATTIYDAVTQLYVKQLGDTNPIPVLCHREHLRPVGVCRVCMVEIEERRRSGRVKKDLVSSCTYLVKDGMIITTSACTDKPVAVDQIRSAVGIIVELLASEHLSVSDLEQVSLGIGKHNPNELKKLVAEYVPSNRALRFAPSHLAQGRGRDQTSEIISVNHDACIMCQRCARACNEIKENDVMARSGKGYHARIAFDTDLTMLESSCVSCGECVISCPTDALTFRPQVIEKQGKKILEQSRRSDAKDGVVVTAEEMLEIPIFAGIPYKFLQFNGGACVRRVLRPGDTLCRVGDYGSTAFLIQRGKFEILVGPKSGPKAAEISRKRGGWLDRWLPQRSHENRVPSLATGSDSNSLKPTNRLFRGVEDVILGEMACLNRQRRTATVVAVEDSEVIEIGSNVLYMLQRNATSRKVLNEAYRRHALNSDIERLPIFQELTPQGRIEAARIIAKDAELLSVEPGRPIFRQGEKSDDLYLIRLGYVKVAVEQGAREQILNYIGPGNLDDASGAFGEIAALSSLYGDELKADLKQLHYRPGVRTTTCSALDHVELVRIRSSQLKEITDSNPEFKAKLLNRARTLLKQDAQRHTDFDSTKTQFVGQGLYNAQSLLVLDLESCTRCDECTKACADAHHGETRLVREGLRFENFLVATSCRSCTDPYCLVGCPVNAIFRQGSKEIVIEDHCIGCGQCATNCPYGNITMYGHPVGVTEKEKGGIPVIQQKATTCDQCRSIGGTPRCVYACPHDAAFRMTGDQLRATVQARQDR
jgi:Fe-S-cluster-containing hydrogenase component 2/CRP-like cAMP-binding protein